MKRLAFPLFTLLFYLVVTPSLGSIDPMIVPSYGTVITPKGLLVGVSWSARLWDFYPEDKRLLGECGIKQIRVQHYLTQDPTTISKTLNDLSNAGFGRDQILITLHWSTLNLEDYRNYIRRTIQACKGKARYYTIINEVNLETQIFRPPSDYVNLLKIAYTEIKAIDPSCLVTFSCLAKGWHNRVENGMYAESYLSECYRLEPNLGDYFDIMAYNYYDFPATYEAGLRQKIEALRRVLVSHGDGDKKLWFCEYGIRLYDDSGRANVNGNERLQAEYTIRSLRVMEEYPDFIERCYIWWWKGPNPAPPFDPSRGRGMNWLYPISPPYTHIRPVYYSVKDYIQEQRP